MEPSSSKKRPWQRLKPRPYRSEAVLLDVPPLAQLDIYENTVIVTRRGKHGRWTSYPVSPEALAQTFANVPSATGLLPPQTLSAGLAAGERFLVLYVAPRVVTLAIEMATGQEQHVTIPLPPLVWAARGTDYRLWALGLPVYPTRGDLPLFKAPFPNCYADGKLCWGNVDHPGPATPGGMLQVLDLFLTGSRFNSHLDNGKSVRKPASVLALYAELNPAEPYPLDDLMPAETHLSYVLAGGPWGAR